MLCTNIYNSGKLKILNFSKKHSDRETVFKPHQLTSYPWHTAYNWNIKCQKCAGMGLNGFIFKKIIKNYAENMKKIVGAV